MRSTHTHTHSDFPCLLPDSVDEEVASVLLRSFFLGKRSDSKQKIMMDKYSLSENYDFAEVEERGRGPAAHSAIAGASPFCIWPVTEFDR